MIFVFNDPINNVILINLYAECPSIISGVSCTSPWCSLVSPLTVGRGSRSLSSAICPCRRSSGWARDRPDSLMWTQMCFKWILGFSPTPKVCHITNMSTKEHNIGVFLSSVPNTAKRKHTFAPLDNRGASRAVGGSFCGFTVWQKLVFCSDKLLPANCYDSQHVCKTWEQVHIRVWVKSADLPSWFFLFKCVYVFWEKWVTIGNENSSSLDANYSN